MQSGKIEFGVENVIDLADRTEKEMQSIRGNQIAMIFQDPLSALNSSQKVGKQMIEQVLCHQKISKIKAKQLVFSLLEKVNLDPPNRFFNAYPFQLSGGQRQRILIAMAMANNPKLIIADEPTTALDVTVQKEIVELFVSLVRSQNISMIFISHDLALVSQIADSIVVMYQGKVVEQGSTFSLINKPKENYTKALLNCKPTLLQKKSRLPEVSDMMHDQGTDSKPRYELNSRIGQTKLLSVENLLVEFNDNGGKNYVRAVDHLSFSLFEGETLGLVGESGCGKTTLSRTLLRLIRFTNGEIRFQGQSLDLFSKNRLQFSKEIQIVFQDPFSSLNPIISVGNALKETIHIHNQKLKNKQCIDEANLWLEKVGLNASFYNRLPRELSGGQRQRVVIARALITKPKILICDEAVSAIDVSVQARMLNLLNDLKFDLGLTYIFISHDLAVVKYMSNRLLIMKNGKIIESGNSEQIYAAPQSEYAKHLINSIPEYKYCM